jgi:hypothetical protein
VLDGEIAVLEGGNFSFDALLQRIHPAASRVKILATRTPAIFVNWVWQNIGGFLFIMAKELAGDNDRLRFGASQAFLSASG